MEEDSSNNNNKTIDQQQQQNIDESQEISKPLDFSGEKKEEDVQQQQQQQIVPVLEEDYSISKQTTIKEAKIEKRLATKTKTVKVPTSYEELYINGKKLKSVEESQILSALKDKISSIATSGNADTSVEQSVKKKNKIENRGELVPLFSSSSAATTAASYDYDEVKGNSETQIEKEKVIPLYEEQFEIIKKMVKVAEIVITKRRVIEKKKIDVDIRGEEVTIKYPDGRSEKLS
jgi:stress response protein YsnF